MAKNRVQTVFEGDNADLIQAVDKINTRLDKMEDATRGVTAESKKLTKQEREFGRETKRALDEIRGPQQRYEQRTRALHALLKQKKITQEQFNTALRRTKERYQTAGRAGQQATGPQALGQLKSMAAGWLSVGTLIAGATKALNDHYEKLNEVVEKQREAAPYVGMLAQLTGGDPKKQAALERAAVKIYKGGGARSEAEAMQVAFQLQSANMLESAEFMTRARVIAGPEGISGLIGKAGKLQAAFGKAETGTAKQILSKAVAAAGPVTDVGMMDILQATAKAGGAGKAMELSDEELFAMVSLTSQVYKPEEAATGVARMLDQLAVKRPELKGKSAQEIVRTLQGEQLSAKQQQKLLGIRGIKAFRLLTPEKLEKRLALIEEGQRTGIVEKDIQTAMGRPGVTIPLLERQTKAKLEAARKYDARMMSLSNSVMNVLERIDVEKGETALGQTVSGWLYGAHRWQAGPEAFTRFALPQIELWAQRRGRDDLLQEVEKLRAGLEQAAANLNTAAENLNASTRERPVVENN